MSQREAAREAVRQLEAGRRRATLTADLEAARAARNGREEASTSWAAVDLAALLDGQELEERPAMLARTDGAHLAYRRRLHAIFGEPEACKGWLALHSAAEQLAAGEHVAYIDFEDTASTALDRLAALGVDPGSIIERFHYVRPDEPLTDAGWRDLTDALDPPPSLAVIDGVTDALTMHGLDLADNGDVARWLKLLPRRIVSTGAAVLLIDHVTKDRETRGRYAIGAQHKLAGADVAYGLEVIKPFGRGQEGRVKITLKKDRPGHLRQHAESGHIADMRLASGPDGAVEIELRAPERTGDTFRPTTLMERVSKAIEAEPGLTKTGIRTAVEGSSAGKDQALQVLAAEGYIEGRQEGQARRFRSVRTYRAADEEAIPATLPQPCRGQGRGHRASCPPPRRGAGSRARVPGTASRRCPCPWPRGDAVSQHTQPHPGRARAARPPVPTREPHTSNGSGCLLDADQVAAKLGVSKRWVYAETRAGRIPHVRLGPRYVRYREQAIDGWLAGLERGAPGPGPGGPTHG